MIVISGETGRPCVGRRGHVWLIVGLSALLVCGNVAFGILNEAHSFAMEAAVEAVENGFTVREDFWTGEMKPGEKKVVKHQLFKGNEYWFWLGSSVDKAWPNVSIYDDSGKLVHVQNVQDSHMASARVLPPKTGTYVILISVEAEGAEAVDWALAYGFR